MENQSLNEKYGFITNEELQVIYSSLCLHTELETRKYLMNMTIQQMQLWHTEYVNRFKKFDEQFNQDLLKYMEDKNKNN